MMKKGVYKNKEGVLYKFIGVGQCVKTREEFVVYKTLYENNQIWICPIDEWEEKFVWVRER